jgi:hypothetical protein
MTFCVLCLPFYFSLLPRIIEGIRFADARSVMENPQITEETSSSEEAEIDIEESTQETSL